MLSNRISRSNSAKKLSIFYCLFVKGVRYFKLVLGCGVGHMQEAQIVPKSSLRLNHVDNPLSTLMLAIQGFKQASWTQPFRGLYIFGEPQPSNF